MRALPRACAVYSPCEVTQEGRADAEGATGPWADNSCDCGEAATTLRSRDDDTGCPITLSVKLLWS